MLYSGPVAGLAEVDASVTRPFLFPDGSAGRTTAVLARRTTRVPPPAVPAGSRRLAGTARHQPPQPARTRRRLPARRADRGHRRLRLRQVHAGQPGPGRGGRRQAAPESRDAAQGPRGPGGRRRRVHRAAECRTGLRPRPAGPARQGGPETDRPHAAVQPRHVHRPLRRRPQGIRGHGRGQVRGASAPAASPSTLPAAAARPARARASSPSNCCSCPAATAPAPSAMARATTRKPSR